MSVSPRFQSNLSRLVSSALLLAALGACSGGNSRPVPGGTVYGPGGAPPGYRPPGQSVPQPPPQTDRYYVSSSPLPMAANAPSIRAGSYALIDARNGALLASRNATQTRAVASIQKLVTALVVLDAGDLDRMVTIASSDIAVEPTRLGVRAGDRYTRKNLIYAFLIKSSNDVAKALARDNAGSGAAFAQKMNAKMRQLGAMNSNFVNPHGLTESGQYSTALDMARVARACYQNSLIRDAVGRKYYSFRFNSGSTTTLKNTNYLLGDLQCCNGMKTGYTVASGRTLITSASSGNRDVILVQLGSKTSYIFDDARTLMTWGLTQMGARNVAEVESGELLTLPDERLVAMLE